MTCVRCGGTIKPWERMGFYVVSKRDVMRWHARDHDCVGYGLAGGRSSARLTWDQLHGRVNDVTELLDDLLRSVLGVYAAIWLWLGRGIASRGAHGTSALWDVLGRIGNKDPKASQNANRRAQPRFGNAGVMYVVHPASQNVAGRFDRSMQGHQQEGHTPRHVRLDLTELERGTRNDVELQVADLYGYDRREVLGDEVVYYIADYVLGVKKRCPRNTQAGRRCRNAVNAGDADCRRHPLAGLTS